MLSLPVIFSDIETVLVRGGPHDINMHISNEATASIEKSYGGTLVCCSSLSAQEDGVLQAFRGR